MCSSGPACKAEQKNGLNFRCIPRLHLEIGSALSFLFLSLSFVTACTYLFMPHIGTKCVLKDIRKFYVQVKISVRKNKQAVENAEMPLVLSNKVLL